MVDLEHGLLSRNLVAVTLTNWLQIGLSVIAVLVGVFFIGASLTGIKLDSLEQSLTFALAGLPSFLILLLLVAGSQSVLGPEISEIDRLQT